LSQKVLHYIQNFPKGDKVMSFDNGGGYFGIPNSYEMPVNKNQMGLLNTDVKAIMYVFSPNQKGIGDVSLRPLTYHFDESFFNSVQEISEQTMRGTDWSPALVDHLMTTKNLSNNMTVSTQPAFDLRTSLLNDKWRFTLLLTDSGSELIGMNTMMSSSSGGRKIRRIYTGYFVDEPFNPTTLSSFKRTLNPNSVMVITHKTVMDMMTNSTRFGPETNMTTRSSEEIIIPQVTKSLISLDGYSRPRELHLMTPSNCMNSFGMGDDGSSFAMPGITSNITNETQSAPIYDLFEQPEHNVGHVLKGILKTHDDFNNRKRMSTRKAEHFAGEEFLGESFQRSAFAKHLDLPRSRPMGILDLDINKSISALDLSAMLNDDLDIIPIDMQAPMFYDTADQKEISVTNQYSFLISSIMSPILNAAGLSEMQFEYQKAFVRSEVKSNFRIISAAANWNVGEEETARMVRAVMTELDSGVFDTIYQSKGDFHVLVSAFATGITTVRLSLVGQGYKCDVDFELPSYLGGVISPLIGTDINNTDNSQSIESLYGIATGSASPGKYFNQDDLDFMEHANNVSFDDPNSWGMELS